jgi:tetratricopeptide (TPR) repeat protein
MKRLAVIPAVICALFVAGSIFARLHPAAAAKDVWLKIESEHFTLIGNASEKDIRKAGARLEQFRQAFSQLFAPSGVNLSVPITVVVFKNDETFRPFKPLYQGRPAEVAGYFQSSDDAAYIALTAGWRETNPHAVIFHEYVHALMSRASPPLPTWLNEGVAEYYSAFEVTGGGKRVWLGKAITSHVRLLRESGLLPLRTLFAVDQASPFYNEADKKSVFYAESWALVHYLLHGDGGHRQPQFRRFINAITQGRPVDESFKQSFQADYATIEQELKNYISRSAHTSKEALLDQQVAPGAAMRTTTLSEAEVQAYLGDLLWRIHRSADGEEFLQRAIAIDPKLAMARLSLGTLRLRQNRYSEARRHFQRAVEADSQNYLAHYYFAFALQREQVDESQYVSDFPAETVEAMRTALAKARQLNPNFADTYKQLAFINLVLGEDLDEAADLINTAIKLSPKREDFVYTLAQIQMRRKDYQAAKQTVGTLAERAVKPDIRERAKSLLEVIARIEERMAEMKAESQSRGAGPQPSSENQSSSRPPLPGQRFQGDQVRGFLTRIDCDEASITLTVKSEARIFKLHTSQPNQLTFVRYTPEIPTSIICGVISPARPVIVTYRSSARSGFDGEPIGVEFVKRDGM